MLSCHSYSFHALWDTFALRTCFNLFRPGWNGWNGTRLTVVVRSIRSCLCPF